MKGSNRQKSNRAPMDNNYMLTVLTACFCQNDDSSQPVCQ
ncbi:Transposase, IS4 [Richelia intracellularis]|nr:Transposase, IS4 [Richelia intracellularis]